VFYTQYDRRRIIRTLLLLAQTANPQKQNCGGDGGSDSSGGSRIWSIVVFEKLLLPHLVKKLPKFDGVQTFINQLSILS